MEDSPEQVLARLARHRDSLAAANRLPGMTARPRAVNPPAAPAPVVTPVVPPEVTPAVDRRAATEFIPPSPYETAGGWRPSHSPVLMTLLGLLSAVGACALAVLAFERFDTAGAIAVAGAMALLGSIGAALRVPGALWWTIGAVIGGVLGRLS